MTREEALAKARQELAHVLLSWERFKEASETALALLRDVAGEALVKERASAIILRETLRMLTDPPAALWVIMTNDYPFGIATTEADRDRMVAELDAKYREAWKRDNGGRPPPDRGHHVYIRAYKFEPNKVST